MKTNHYKKLLFLFIFLFIISINIFAAAGGAGGGHSGGGGSSSGGGDGGAIFYIIYYLFQFIIRLPFPLNIIVLVVVLFIIYKVAKSYQAVSGLNQIPNYSNTTNAVSKQDKIPSDFTNRNPDFNKD